MVKKAPLLLALSVLVILVLILASFFAIRYFNLVPSARQGGEAPLQISLGSVIDARLTELVNGALANAAAPEEGSVVSRARRSDIGMSATALMPPNTLGAALILEARDSSRKFAGSATMKDAVALSFDGGLIAYAELNAPPGSLLYSENVSDWRVRVLNVATGEESDLGAGYAPYFISHNPDVLVFSSHDGIVSVELGSDEKPIIFSQNTTENIVYAAHASPDGRSLLAHNALTGQWDIYSITQAHPLALSASGAVQSPFDRVALSDTHLYGVYRDEATNTMTLWRYPLDAIAPLMRLEDGELLYTFAESENPYQIVP